MYRKFWDKNSLLDLLKGEEDYFSSKLCIKRIKDNTNSPHDKFHRFLFS